MNQNTRKTCTPWTIGDGIGLRPCLRQLLTLAVVSSFVLSARAELDLTAEMTSTPGLPGFQTFRITATSDLGNIVGYDFSSSGNYGITGPMNQLQPFSQPTVFQDSGFAWFDPAQDSHFLFNCTDVVSLFPAESANDLHAAFALAGDKQLTIGNSVPFLQLATQSAADIMLKGALVIRRPDDQLVQLNINTKLSDITIGAAPTLAILPVPPPQPDPVIVVQPPVQPPRVPDPTTVQPNPVIPPPTTVQPPIVTRPPIENVPPGVIDPTDPSVLPVDPSLVINQGPVSDLPLIRVYIGDHGLLTDPINWQPLHIDLDGDVLGQAVQFLTTDDLPPPNGFYAYHSVYTNSLGVLEAASEFHSVSSAGFLNSLAPSAKLLEQIDSSRPVPEPSATLLLLIGVVGATAVSSRRNRTSSGLLPNQL